MHIKMQGYSIKNHYVYEIIYPSNKHYIGMRSCNCPIAEDNYSGSSKYIPQLMRIFGQKTILKVCATREEALEEEVRLHKLYNVKDNPNFYNKANQTSTKFTMSLESIRKGAEKRRGRTKHTHEYIAKQVEARRKYKGEGRTEAQKQASKNPETIAKANLSRSKYVGDNQTEAQKLGNITQGLKQRGTKNPAKGRAGTTNNGFNPWYYITPDNDYVEVTHTTKQEYAVNFQVTARQLGHRFHHTNINKRTLLNDLRVPQGLRGYVFGNLNTATD